MNKKSLKECFRERQNIIQTHFRPIIYGEIYDKDKAKEEWKAHFLKWLEEADWLVKHNINKLKDIDSEWRK